MANVERILQPTTDFIRGNPIVSTAAVGAGVTGLVAGAAVIRRRSKKTKKKKAKKTTKRSTKKRTRKKRSKAELKRIRLKNLAKARRARKSGKRRSKSKRKIIRGRGLGSKEIRHSGRSTKGKFKIVQFRDKKTGKMVRFKARR